MKQVIGCAALVLMLAGSAQASTSPAPERQTGGAQLQPGWPPDWAPLQLTPGWPPDWAPLQLTPGWPPDWAPLQFEK
ncbi:hypothetical protein F0U62_32500 [Cystobacter fuscus]|uniref:hypothetical protein n=1 Tax=Cystobacter fuscus TaxID=43 RepID=UPI002B304543|nr:hypothetical protein F0U62_32500 [Cystobacter fuscus]